MSLKIGDLFVKLGLKKDEFDKGLNNAKKETSAFGSAMNKIGSTIAGVFAVGAIVGFISNIIAVRKEFEKYEAVLANSLGSHQAARQEMKMLQDIASQTPFSLSELTSAYVKMVNYGLKPTREEIIKLGDLASSTGKGFQQLVEAVADATTGQYERLKEFGIKASAAGDKVTFTFKEQKTTVDNNASSIKQYLITLGDLQGVSGSMAAISETLGGRISNLGDAWDSLLNTLGKGTSGIMLTTIKWLSNFISLLDLAYKSVEDIKRSIMDQSTIDSMNAGLEEIAVIEKSLIKNGMDAAEAHKRAIDLYISSIDNTIKSQNEYSQRGQRIINSLKAEREAILNHFRDIEKAQQKSGETEHKTALEQLADIKAINDELEAQRILNQNKNREGAMGLITPIGTPKSIPTEPIEFSAVFGNLDSSYAAVSAKNKKFTEEFLQDWKDFSAELNRTISDGIANAISSLAEGLGELATGSISGGEFGKQILSVIGGFMKTLGGLMIAYAVNMALFAESAKNPLAWPVALAAGVALVAAGAAISSFAKGGVSGGKSAVAASGYSPSSSSSAVAAISGNVVFELEGNKLRGVLNNQDRKNSLIR